MLIDEWQAFDKQHIWHPFTPLQGAPSPRCIVKGKGALLYTAEGETLIDAVSSWWVNIHGHAHPRLAQVLYEQASQLEHVIFAGFTHPWALKLSQELLTLLPHPYERIFFSDNGSTAVEVAIKLALQYHANHKRPRKQIIALEGGYHGDTFGAMSLGGRSLFTAPFQEHLFEVLSLPFPSCQEQEAHAMDKLEEALGKPTAAFVFEPLVQAAGGMRTYSSTWLDKAMKLCKDAGALCIADEVFTGFGRTGKLFASNYLKESPCLITLSKGLTGGTMPMSITAVSKKVCEAFEDASFEKTFFHGHSYTANPLACRVAIESLSMLQEKESSQALAQLSQAQADFFSSVSTHPAVDNSRSLGTIGALTLKSNLKSTYDHPLRTKIYEFFLARGLLIRPLGNVIYVLPPYVITKEQLSKVYEGITAFLSTLNTQEKDSPT